MPAAVQHAMQPDYVKDDQHVSNERNDAVVSEWLQDMLQRPDEYQLIMNASDLVLGKTALTPDHMFTAFLRHNLINDIVCLYNASNTSVYNAYHLGSDTCGHPGIIHGGLTSSVIDESFGILVYMLKSSGTVAKGPAFTANLQVDFRAPIPAGIQVLCRCWLESVERRKIWLRAEVCDGPDGTLFAEAKALFVNAREGTVSFDHMTAFPTAESCTPGSQ